MLAKNPFTRRSKGESRALEKLEVIHPDFEVVWQPQIDKSCEFKIGEGGCLSEVIVYKALEGPGTSTVLKEGFCGGHLEASNSCAEVAAPVSG